MRTVSRRGFVGSCGAVAVVALAGCTDEEPEFLVTNTQLVHQPGGVGYDYPEDVLVRVSVENGFSSERTATLTVMLTHEPSGDGSGETWTRTDEVSVSQAASIQPEYVFDDVFDDGDDIGDYSASAELAEQAPA